MHGDRGAMVSMWRCGCAGREVDFETQDALGGSVEKSVFIEDFEGWEGSTTGRIVSFSAASADRWRD